MTPTVAITLILVSFLSGLFTGKALEYRSREQLEDDIIVEFSNRRLDKE